MGTVGGYRGAQFDHAPEGSFRTLEQFQGTPAPFGVETVLPFKLKHRPRTREAVSVFAGEAPQGNGQLQRLGIDYDVDIEARKIRWLATARKGLGSTATIVVRYWRRREFDATLSAKGIA